MTTAEELAMYARTIQGTGQSENYELCRDAAKSLAERIQMHRNLVSEYDQLRARFIQQQADNTRTLRELNELRRAVDYFKDGARRLGFVVK